MLAPRNGLQQDLEIAVCSAAGCAHAVVVAGCLQITLYHQEACEAVDEDSLLELCDWGYRKLLSLNSKVHKQSKAQGGLCAGDVP